MGNISIKKLSWPLVLLSVLLVGVGGIGGYLFGANQASTLTLKSVRYSGSYNFINPPLYSEVPESIAIPQYASLKEAITESIEKATAEKKVSDVGVYFRDLNENRWIGVNETHQFAPGSLLKVGAMMTVLRLTDTQPERLSAKLRLVFGADYQSSPQSYFPPTNPVQAGGVYSVESLLTHLIVESDNRAADALDYYFGQSELMKTFNDLQVSIGDTPSGVVTSPQEYSHMFRALYNGSYLSHEASERALNLLSKTTFTDGLVAGVPANTIVSHKFGERSPWLEDHASSASEENVNQLHDCGIVYFPSHPYFLCVMTKGQAGVDFPLLATVIQDISRVTWEHVNDKNK